MFWLAQAEDLDYYLLPGSETGMAHQLLSGHIPILAPDSLVLGLAMGASLLLLARLLSLVVDRRQGSGRLSGRQALLLRLAIFVGFFAAWELALQSGPHRPEETYIPDPLAFWKANPAVAQRVLETGKGLVGVDRRRQVGLFDQDHAGPKPPGTWRIAFMGDSQVLSSNGQPYAGNLTYSKALEAHLGRDGLAGPQGQPVEILNAGMSGYSSWQGLMLLRSEVLRLEPDVVVEAFGYHDSNLGLSVDREVLTDDPWTFEVRTRLYRSRVCVLLRNLLLRIQAARNDRSDPSTRVPRVPPAQFAENLRTLERMGREHGFRVVFLLEPLRDPGDWDRSRDHREAARRTAQELGVPLLDGFQLFREMSQQERDRLFHDAIHLTPAGHARMEELVRRGLVETRLLAPVPRRAKPGPG